MRFGTGDRVSPRAARRSSLPRLTTSAGRRFALTVLFRKRITSAGFFGGGYDVGEDDVEDDISGDEYEAAEDAGAATDAAPTWRRPVASLDEVLLEAALTSLMAQDPRREALVAAHAAGKLTGIVTTEQLMAVYMSETAYRL